MWNALLTHALRPQLMDAATTFIAFVFSLLGRLLAYGSFCQQRKEELAIMCSFSGECGLACSGKTKII
jgi:hypothetical protein